MGWFGSERSVGYCYYWIIGLILWVVGSWGYVRGFIDSWGRGVVSRVWIIGVLVILIEWCGDSRSPWGSIWLRSNSIYSIRRVSGLMMIS